MDFDAKAAKAKTDQVRALMEEIKQAEIKAEMDELAELISDAAGKGEYYVETTINAHENAVVNLLIQKGFKATKLVDGGPYKNTHCIGWRD